MNRTPRIIPLTLTATLLGTRLTGCGALSDTASDASSTTSQSTAATVAEATAGAAAAADVLAANAEVHTGDLEYEEADVRTVTLSGDSASTGAEGVTVDGATVTIAAPGTYRLTGTLTGQVVVDSSAEGAVQIILAPTSRRARPPRWRSCRRARRS